MILLIIICAGVRLWTIQNIRGIYPPDHVSSNGDQICVHYNHSLYYLNPEGQLLKSLDLAGLGLSGKPSDLQLLGNGDVLIGDFDKGEIVRCKGPETSCVRIGPAGDYVINENFTFLADEQRNLLFIADTNDHRVLVQDLEGSFIKEIESESNIKYPNGMALDNDGRLWLSNTYYKKLISFSINGDSVVETEDAINLRPRITAVEQMVDTMGKDPPESPGDLKELMEKIRHVRKEKMKLGDDLVHIRPVALTWDTEGDVWVVAGDLLITTAGIRIFSPEGKQLDRVKLGHGAIPIDIDRVGDNMLIADSGLFQFFLVNMKTGGVSEFGDGSFQNALAQVRSKLRRYEGIKGWAGGSIWLLVLGTIILVLIIVIKNYNDRDRAAQAKRVYTAAEVRSTDGSAGLSDSSRLVGALKRYRLSFTGSGGEYFRIWIVNTFLTILTFGIYAAWAKVRNRKYFYKNTLLDGHSFDYTANPLAIFKGYVIIGSGLLLYYLSEAFNPLYSLVILGLFALVMPFLIYKSLRFFMHNSVYRNIRFRFLGKLGNSYRAYLLLPLLIPFTLGFIFPYWAFEKKKYFFHNLAFGSSDNTFRGKPGPFFQVYIAMGAAVIGVSFITMIVMSFFFAGLSLGSSPDEATLGGSIIFMIIFIYAITLIVFNFAQQYIYAWVTNYCFKHSELGELRFESTLKGGKLFWIRISNIFAIIFSAGLLIPWAKVRRMRYIVDNISLVSGHSLNDFTAAVETDESAYGDAATDFFDLEIGL
jgi:uncharacterized membrane protein YjgN (DUF898 family)